MADTTHIAGGHAPTNTVAATAYNPVVSVDVPPGTPLAPTDDGDAAVPARAIPSAAFRCAGLASAAGAANGRVVVQPAGVLTLETAQWDAITAQSGGLTKGRPYYLSAGVAGKITRIKPSDSGEVVAEIGIALSSRDLLIRVSDPIPN